jgi:lipoprotein-anchoring transpeptidase ErfK/SrfK
MQRVTLAALLASVCFVTPALAEPPILNPADPAPVRYASAQRVTMGGGFIEMLFSGGEPASGARYQSAPDQNVPGNPGFADPAAYARGEPAAAGEPAYPAMDQRYLPRTVEYGGHEKPGTIIINTNERYLYLVEDGGRALRYGIGVGRPGFTWAGVHQITNKREWPGWRPPDEMLKRRPDLPRYMVGGPNNPLGARAMYLGSTLYRIHGSNEPWTIGQAVSSGCIRMRNEDVIDLYGRVKVGTKVVVI